MDIRYDIEKPEIESKYFALLSKYHPDRASSKEESSKFSQLSSIINDGYQILLDDFKRASHILELNNININDDATAPKLPIEILSEILEIQEELEDNPNNRQQILKTIEPVKDELIASLKDLFEKKDYPLAAQKAMHLKYLKLI